LANGIIRNAAKETLLCTRIRGYVEELLDLSDDRLAAARAGDLGLLRRHE
jgi:hypothetical protein